MGLRLSNRQLKMLTEVVLRESKDSPNVEWDELLNRMVEMCRFRGMTITWNAHSSGDAHDLGGLAARVERERELATVPRDNGSVQMKVVSEAEVHPLFRDSAA